jgi:hypothetical protein
VAEQRSDDLETGDDSLERSMFRSTGERAPLPLMFFRARLGPRYRS